MPAKQGKKAKLGFVGCGWHASAALYPTIPTIPEINLVAVCDLKEKLAIRNTRNFGARRWYADVDKMLSKEELDGVIVVGHPSMQCKLGKVCLDAGLPIFVEKPSAISYKKAMDLAEHAERKNLFGMVGFMKRFATGYRMAKEIVRKQEFGKISFIDVKFSFGPLKSAPGIKENPKSFLIIGFIHIFDLIRYFGGEIVEVFVKLNQIADDRFGFAIIVEFENGVVGVMNLNSLESNDLRLRERLNIAGDCCYVEVIDMLYLKYRPKQIYFPEFTADGRNQTFNWQPDWGELPWDGGSGQMLGYRGELKHFARCLLHLEKPSPDLWDGAKSLQIAEAVWESAQSKKPVKIH